MQMTSTAGSTMPSADRVKRAAVVLHGRPEALGSGLARLESVAKQEGVELVLVAGDAQESPADVEVAIVLGGDGTMLRALQRFLGTGVPVIGVNFGRVGFLSSIPRDELERGIELRNPTRPKLTPITGTPVPRNLCNARSIVPSPPSTIATSTSAGDSCVSQTTTSSTPRAGDRFEACKRRTDASARPCRTTAARLLVPTASSIQRSRSSAGVGSDSRTGGRRTPDCFLGREDRSLRRRDPRPPTRRGRAHLGRAPAGGTRDPE